MAQAPRGKVTVVVRATDRSWVQVTTTSGQELFQGLLQRGQQKTFTDKTRLKLVIGNAGGVDADGQRQRRSVLPGAAGRSPGCSSRPRIPAAG